MPKFLEDRLAAGAAKAGLRGRKAQAYIYGALNNMGAMRGSRETAKGRRMERKHEQDTKSSGAHEALTRRFGRS